MKNYIFGDTGGHMKQFFNALKEIGVEPRTGHIPEDVRIIHLGDLIHKGPHSSLLIDRVNTLMRRNPGQYVQLLGNHEFQHIEGSPYFWRCNCSMEDIGTINDWFDEGFSSASYGLNGIINAKFEVSEKPKLVVPENQGIFFSHAGLSHHWWDVMKAPSDPVVMAETINNLDVWVVTTPGEMLGVSGMHAGPVWATGNNEVFNDWEQSGETMPFIQMHGHTTSYNWVSKKWWRHDKAFMPFKNATKLNPETHAVITQMAGSLLVGIDPGYSNKAFGEKQPYVMIESVS